MSDIYYAQSPRLNWLAQLQLHYLTQFCLASVVFFKRVRLALRLRCE